MCLRNTKQNSLYESLHILSVENKLKTGIAKSTVKYFGAVQHQWTWVLTSGGGRGVIDPLDLVMLEKAAFWSAMPCFTIPEKNNPSMYSFIEIFM